jgi:hypothetical protein
MFQHFRAFFTLNESNQITKIIGFAEFSYTGNAYASQKKPRKNDLKKTRQLSF